MGLAFEALMLSLVEDTGIITAAAVDNNNH